MKRVDGSADGVVDLKRAWLAGDARLCKAVDLLDVAVGADELGQGQVRWYLRAPTDPDHRLLRLTVCAYGIETTTQVMGCITALLHCC